MIKQEFEMINGEWLPVIKEVADEEIIDNRSRKERIIERIRERYSVDDEIALIRQKEIKKEEFNEYFNFVEKVKEQIK